MGRRKREGGTGTV
uniref:Uncharacterized protein n=1 Tax=Arundo donax TaxID=35708 RepID=A0A0A9FZP0_ARUDO